MVSAAPLPPAHPQGTRSGRRPRVLRVAPGPVTLPEDASPPQILVPSGLPLPPLVIDHRPETVSGSTPRHHRKRRLRRVKLATMDRPGYGENPLARSTASIAANRLSQPSLAESSSLIGGDSYMMATTSIESNTSSIVRTGRHRDSACSQLTATGETTASSAIRAARRMPAKQLPQSYTTVFNGPHSVSRRLMTNSERLQYLLLGVQPLSLRPQSLQPVAYAEAASAAPLVAAARQHVSDAIEEREVIVRELQWLLPVPQDKEERDASTVKWLRDGEVVFTLRTQLASLLGLLRRTSVDICRGIAEWRDAMRRSHAEMAVLPAREITFCWQGISYLLKMTTDLAFLPVPITHDPLLLSWFREQLPWLLSHVPRLSQRAHAQTAAQLAPSFNGSLEAAALPAADLQAAHHMLLEEVSRCSVPRAPSMLVRAARERTHSGVIGLRWQWSAFQLLLYGGESYARMLQHLSTCVQTLHLGSAAVVVQRGYRQRLARKLVRTKKALVERHNRQQAQKQIVAAINMQAIWRGFFLRTAMRETVEDRFAEEEAAALSQGSSSHGSAPPEGGHSLSERSGKPASEARIKARAELAARKAQLTSRRKQQAASGVIQRRARVVHARAEIHRARLKREEQARRARSMLSDKEPALTRIRTLINRQRELRRVMWEVYNGSLGVSAASAATAASLRRGALSSSLTLTKLLTRANQLSDEQRVYGRRIAERAVECMHASISGGDEGAARGAHSAAWSAVVSRAMDEAKAAGDSRDGQKDAMGSHTVDGLTAVAGSKAPRVAVDVTAMLQGARQARLSALLAACECNAQAQAWDELARASDHSTMADASVATAAAEAARTKARATETALEEAESDCRSATTVPNDVINLDAMLTTEAAPKPGSTSGQLSEDDAIDELGKEAAHKMAGAVLILDEALDWDVLSTASLAAQHALCDAYRHELLSRASAAAHPNSPSLKLQAAHLAHAEAKGMAAVASAAAKLHEVKSLDEPGGASVAAETLAHAAQNGAEAARSFARAARAVVSSIDQWMLQSKTDIKTWLEFDGSLALIRALHADACEPITKRLKTERYDAYRAICSSSPGAQSEAKQLRQRIAELRAAEGLASELLTLPVCNAIYEEGTISVALRKFVPLSRKRHSSISGSGSQGDGHAWEGWFHIPLVELVTLLGQSSRDAADAKERVLESMAEYLEVGEERLHFVSIQSIEAEPSHGGDEAEPIHDINDNLSPQSRRNYAAALRIVIGVRREAAGEVEAKELLMRLVQAHELGRLGEVMLPVAVGKGAVASCSISSPQQTVTERPTLEQMAISYEQELVQSEEELVQLHIFEKSDKRLLLAQDRLEGATELVLERLAGGDAGKNGGKEGDERDSVDAHGSNVSRVFLSPYLGLHRRSAIMTSEAIVHNKQRAHLRDRCELLQGRLHLIRALQRTCDDWPEVALPGKATTISPHWNMCIPENPNGEGDTEVDKSRQFCYYCASLPQPRRAPHALMSCPKRIRANRPEYTEEGFAKVVSKIKALRETLEQEVDALGIDTATHAEGEATLTRLTGSLNVLSRLSGPLPPPPPSSPASERRDELQALLRRNRTLLQVCLDAWRLAQTHLSRRHLVARAYCSFRCLQSSSPALSSCALVRMPSQRMIRRIAFECRSEARWWYEMRAVLLSRPHPRLMTDKPITPAEISAVGLSVGVDLAETGQRPQCFFLMPLLIDLSRSPLPPHWHEIDERAPSNDGKATFQDVRSGLQQVGHPMSTKLRPFFAQLLARDGRHQHARGIDSWAVFADNEGAIYCFDFASATTSEGLLPDAVIRTLTRSVLPFATLEPSAEKIAQAAFACWPGLEGLELLNAATAQLWEAGAKGARAAHLAKHPCSLSLVLQMSLYLGVDPHSHSHLLWLAHAALTPEMPAGWVHCSNDESAEPYYSHPASGMRQWEHPHVSFLAGVARRLVDIEL